ncbi:MAG: hypothetical protein AseanaTS_01200 [Candidatus Pelagadaptatus aseana]|uniref:hypothetical protein n=1 Tax=Candidatus Pelagadaptatus aseana TaxID=3120508 RepID=UPI0039B2D63E
MNDRDLDKPMAQTVRRALDMSEQELQADAELQNQLHRIRHQAMAHVPAAKTGHMPGWMVNGALACAAVVAFSVLFLPMEQAPQPLPEQAWLATESELLLEMEAYELEPEFYEWAMEVSDGADS